MCVDSHRYKSHPNRYLPRYQTGSETDAEEERARLLRDDPSVSPAMLPYDSPALKGAGFQRSRGPTSSPSGSGRYYQPPLSPLSSNLNPTRNVASSSFSHLNLGKGTNSDQLPQQSQTPAQQMAGFPRMGIRKLPNTSSSPEAQLASRVTLTHSAEIPSYQVLNNRRFEGNAAAANSSHRGKDCNADEFEVMSLCGNDNSNASVSDLENVCEIEDSEINSEFEN